MRVWEQDEESKRGIEGIAQTLKKPRWRWMRFLADIALDSTLVLGAFCAAVGLADDLRWPANFNDVVITLGLPLTLLTAGLLVWRGAHRINARYLGFADFMNLTLGVALSAVLFGTLQALLSANIVYSSGYLGPLLYFFLALSALCGVRVVQRVLHVRGPGKDLRSIKRRRTLVVGAGDMGEAIVRELNRSRQSEHYAVAFVDDNLQKIGQYIRGVKVVGTTEQIPYLVSEYSIDDIVIATPDNDGVKTRRLVELCDRAGARIRILPPMAQLLAGNAPVQNRLREVDIEDLLRREPVKIDSSIPSHYISAQTVLVTGGGGSIGGELARQIARLAPANLILLGKGENSVYEIEQELIQELGFTPKCVIADIRDRASVEEVFERFAPQVVFHAAAHKHVPLMEGNPTEAIKNNIFGTYTMAELAVRYGVRKFVYISTDKAVRPSSVMGATKRVGEMIVRAFAERSETEFSIVRFGNVLGSRGSLIPMLKKQIAKGGPVRLTHPEMTRYFMTIPEAVQLILQAAAMGTHGELFILDMGEPVKIVDLAKDLIRLHGLAPGEDIEIQFTGVRPGEKTHEELVYAEEELEPTIHKKIRMVKRTGVIDESWLKEEIQNLRTMVESHERPEAVRQQLMELAWGKSAAPFRFAATEREDATPASEPPESQS
jgi:FlaA1/EpsC-like NDP-sugar epimerase